MIWSRGNFDTSDGLVKTGSNTYNHDAADYTAYLGMGETWSVPAVGFVKPSLHITGRRPAGVEFALYLGSGYSDVATEGKTFFALDALSGDVIQSFPLPNGTVTQAGLTLPNVIAGSPAIYTVESSTQKSPQGFVGITAFLSNPVEAQAKQVYFGDLHSRIWRYSPSTPGVAPVVMADLSSDSDQPFANGLSLLDFGSVPQVFASSGRDSRVAVRANPPRFRMYGYSDGPSGNPVAPFAQLFAVDFPANYRGNSAPAAGFIGGDTDNDPATPDVVNPIVFFTGLSFAAGSDPHPALPVSLRQRAVRSSGADRSRRPRPQQRFDSPIRRCLRDDRGPGSPESPHHHGGNAGHRSGSRGPGRTSSAGASARGGGSPDLAPRRLRSRPGYKPGTQAFIDLKSTTTPFRIGTAVCNVNP